MKECNKFNECAFTHCNKQYKLLSSVDHYVEDYCRGNQMSSCIRLRIEDKQGALHVPTNMMPNGLPLPGSHRRDWTEIALEFKKHI